MTRHGALFSATLAAYSAGIRLPDLTARDPGMLPTDLVPWERVQQRMADALDAHATDADRMAIGYLTSTDAETVGFYLDQFADLMVE